MFLDYLGLTLAGGSIGAGLFVGSGGALATGGTLSMLRIREFARSDTDFQVLLLF